MYNMLCDSFFVVIERMQNGKIPLYKPVSLFIHSYVTSTATTRKFLHFMINAEMYNLVVLKHSEHKHNYTFTAKTKYGNNLF